jgi:hypothetical protein
MSAFLIIDKYHESGILGLRSLEVGSHAMRKPPESYLDCRRPPIQEAMRLEGDMTISAAAASLINKGYFTPRPRPWKLGYRDRGLGHGHYAILDRFGDVVAENINREDAELIILAVNSNESAAWTIQVSKRSAGDEEDEIVGNFGRFDKVEDAQKELSKIGYVFQDNVWADSYWRCTFGTVPYVATIIPLYPVRNISEIPKKAD